ncbi:MAG TPA: hypothetical protein VE869_11715 [Gemmatimonas sp.]|nr:hypothetical protein [Gemmatimonas sp.]
MASFLSRLFGSADHPSLMVRGLRVDVDNTRADIRTEDVVERLDAALTLIEQYQPLRFRHLQRDVRAISVERYPCRGAFRPDDRTVITELTFLARRDISAAPVASSILHEGVHARVHAFSARVLGGRGHARDMAREERLCRRAEITFGRALPPALGAPVLERALATLELDDRGVAPVVDWATALQRQREVDGGS